MNITKRLYRFLLIFFCISIISVFSGCSESLSKDIDVTVSDPETAGLMEITEDGTYTSKDDVALYIYTYEHLPSNFITKYEARKLGWNGGSLDDVAYGKCIGGDRFKNREGLLPDSKDRSYYECDIDTLHKKKRGAKRIIYSDDGLIYYTEDHYASYELLYGDP